MILKLEWIQFENLNITDNFRQMKIPLSNEILNQYLKIKGSAYFGIFLRIFHYLIGLQEQKIFHSYNSQI